MDSELKLNPEEVIEVLRQAGTGFEDKGFPGEKFLAHYNRRQGVVSAEIEEPDSDESG